MDDAIDVVDDQDRSTGRLVSREVACGGDSMALHRCIAVFAFDSKGRLYVQTHKKSGLFDHSVGGHVDAGEDYATAARREAEEELGLVNVPFHEIGRSVRAIEQHRDHMFGIYECFLDDAWSFIPNEEVDEVTPMKLKDVVHMVNEQPERFTSGFIYVLKFYIKKKGLPLTVYIDALTKQRAA